MPFRIIRNDITKMNVDAIVNTANEEPIYSSGTDKAVYEAAGVKELLEARQKIGVLSEGDVAITSGFQLPANYIIHAASPCYKDGHSGEEIKLRSCYEKSLQIALEYGCKSIAFPLISTGNFGYPKSEGLEIALNVIQSFLMKEEMTIYLVVFDQESVRLSGLLYDEIEAFIDENYVAEQQVREYGYRDLSECKYRALHDDDLSSEKVRYGAEDSGDEEFDSDYEFYEDDDDEFEETIYQINEVTMASDSAEDAESDEVESDDVSGSVVPVSLESLIRDVLPERFSAQRSLDDILANVGETFQQMLFRLIEEKGREEVEVYKGACKDKRLFYKIRSNVNYQPTKHTVYAFAISLRLSLQETKDLLQTAGFAMSRSNRFDLIMTYVFEREIYDMYKIDCILYDFGEEHYFSCE